MNSDPSPKTTRLMVMAAILATGAAAFVGANKMQAGSSVGEKTVEPETPRNVQSGNTMYHLLPPQCFADDVAAGRSWLPAEIRTFGIEQAYQNRMADFAQDNAIRQNLIGMRIPPWMIALIPSPTNTLDPDRQRYEAEQQDEIRKQLRNMNDLAGNPPQDPLAQRAEQLLIFAGAAQLPTPGYWKSGVSLGSEGCTAALWGYVVAQLEIEFPDKFKAVQGFDDHIQSSVQLKQFFARLERAGIVSMASIPFDDLQYRNFTPGGIVIAEKPDGAHVMGLARAPRFWGYDESDILAIGNTGLPQFGPPQMHLAQEYVSNNPDEPWHNYHGPITSHARGPELDYRARLTDSRTNVYAAVKGGSRFIIIDFGKRQDRSRQDLSLREF